MTEQNEDYKRLIDILVKLFQLDQADLDFGIYRIMNQKREEVSDFLENELVTQIKETLEAYADEDKDKLKKELGNLEKTLRDAGVDVDSNEKVLNLRKKVAKTDVTDLQNNVFSHLTNFFKRYYKEGDFISQRRYKDDIYAIPYQGEEVKLHWANHDQYYIKTSEYFKNYRFKLRNNKWVNFELREASTEQNNNKAQNGERKFKLAEENIYNEEDNTLTIYFTYEPMSKNKKQKKLRKQTFEMLKEELPPKWRNELLRPNPTNTNKNRTELEKHLKDYTARNTFDYFIHEDLGKFLHRELDFYIKNEILEIDDIDLDKQESYQQSLKVIKAFKKVALKIIRFLAQIEDFQKKLWLKKKFVLQSDYCITLDRVDEAFYKDIAGNDRQRKEWIDLYAINELDDYSEPLSVDFLRDNPFLMVDTKFFDRDWKYRLLATFDDLDAQTDGLMINSENFQALNFIKERYKEKIKCIYSDPPYNTSASEILYKNNYKHSSWLSLMSDRLKMTKDFLQDDGLMATTIDDVEFHRLRSLLQNIYGSDRNAGTIAIRINPSGRPTTDGLALSHEYAIINKKSSDSVIHKMPRTKEQLARYNEEDEEGIYELRNLRREGSNSNREDGKRQFYPFFVDKDSLELRVPKIEWDESKEAYNILEEIKENEVIVYPINNKGIEKNWRWSWENVEADYSQFEAKYQGDDIQIYYKYRPNTEGITPFSFWKHKKYSATEYGTRIIKQIFGTSVFSYPKSIHAVEDVIFILGLKNKEGTCLDFFAGSGTTGHAVINLNREDSGNRNYLMVEMGKYFDSVMKPRIQKVVYSKEWKDGQPVDRNGTSHCFKYLRLESYEDTLNNLSLKRNGQQQELIENEELRDEYMVNYMLEVESRDSLLTTEMFNKPFGYTLEVTEHNERKETEVDLVETFNYLIGLNMESIQLDQGYVVIVGYNNDGEQILVVWRNMEKHDNEALETFFRTVDLSIEKNKLDTIYVNGDDNLETIRQKGEGWKVKLIEKEFHKRMFERKGL